MAPRSPLAPRVRAKPAGRYHHGELRRALLDATLAIVGRDGTGAVSLRAVARRVGVSPQATCNHFASKAALLAAAAEEGLRELERQMRSARAEAPNPAARLEAIGVAYVTFGSSSSAHFRLLGAPELADLPAHPDLLVAYRDAFAILVEAIEECQRAGVVRAAEPRKLAFTAWATVHGVAWLVVDGQLAIAAAARDAEQAARDAMRILYRGLGAETRSATERTARRPRPRS